MSAPATAAASPAETRRYAAHGQMARAWSDHSAEIMLEGPAGSGKTRMGLELTHWRAKKYPRSRHLLCRKTRESLTESALVTFETKVLTATELEVLGAGADRSHRQRYTYPNGSEIVVAGLVANRTDQRAKVMSTDYDTVYIPEGTELTEHEWEQLGTRCRNGKMPYQQLAGDCNPDAPTHWLHQRCDRGQTKVYFARHADNPSVTPEYLERLSKLTGVRRARLFEGRRVAAEGTVYDGFDHSVHLIDPFPIPADWTRFRSIDFGTVNPFVCGWLAIDPDGRLYLYREWYMSQRTVKAHAEKIKELSAGETYLATVSDHDSSDRATLRECGIETLAADKDILKGIGAVQERLKVQIDGRPRLFVMRGCLVEADPILLENKLPVCTEQEWGGYVWKRGSDGKPLTKEKPVDRDDHGLDMLRYGTMFADRRQRIGGRRIEVW